MERPHRTTSHVSYRDKKMHLHPGETGNSEVMNSRDIGSHYTLNTCMTNSQIAQERLRAVEQEATLARIQAEYDRLMALRSYEQEAALAQIEAKYTQQLKFLSDILRTAKQALSKTRVNLAGIRRLPQEILGEIFIIHVRSNNSSPWVLMHVCRAWRNAALGTRALWGAIQLVPPSKAPSLRVRNVEGREICMKESQLDRALARAASTPLDLQISFNAKAIRRYYFTGETPWSVKQQNHIEKLLGRVANKMDKTKIRSLNLEVNGCALFSFDRFTFHNLETLILDDHYPKVIEKAGNQAAHLRHLTLVGSDLEKLANRPWVVRLEGLDVLAEKRYDTVFNVPAIYSLLQRLTSLHSLGIEVSVGMALRSYRSEIDLPHLQVLDYRSRIYPGCLDVFIVPILREFHLSGARTRTYLHVATTPNIDPLVFHLHHAKIHIKNLANVIRNMTRVEEVRIEHTEMGNELFNELHPIRPPKTKDPRVVTQVEMSVCASTMKVLSLDMSGCKPKEDAKSYEKAAKELLTTRRNANMPMEKIAVRLTEKDGWIVFKDE